MQRTNRILYENSVTKFMHDPDIFKLFVPLTYPATARVKKDSEIWVEYRPFKDDRAKGFVRAKVTSIERVPRKTSISYAGHYGEGTYTVCRGEPQNFFNYLGADEGELERLATGKAVYIGGD